MHLNETTYKINFPAVRDWWTNHRTSLLVVAIGIMTILAILRLKIEFYRLLWEPSQNGAIDLKILHTLVHQWFAGQPVYEMLQSAVHPPITYAMLWPFLGWLDVTQARWLWAVTSVIMLAWLAYILLCEARSKTPIERIFLVVLLLSMYPTSITIGNGQVILHLLPPLLTGIILLNRRQAGWCGDLSVSFLLLFSLLKPSVSVPFFWIVLFASGALRPVVIIAIGYISLTFLALSFQPHEGLINLLYGWMENSSALAARGGYADLHIWLTSLGLEGWIFPASLLALAALGIWTYRHRHVDLWLVLGVSAIVARIWTYHRVYDDLLILLPMIVLFRITKQGLSVDGSDVLAGILLTIAIVAVLAPARLLTFPPPSSWMMATGQVVVWLLMLLFLLNQARRERISVV